jgi:hypothetical protein
MGVMSVDLKGINIVIMKGPGIEEFAPLMCEACHDKDHKHLPMVIMPSGKLQCGICKAESGTLEETKTEVNAFGIVVKEAPLTDFYEVK